MTDTSTVQQDRYLDTVGATVMRSLERSFQDVRADVLEREDRSVDVWTFGVDGPVHHGSVVIPHSVSSCVIAVSREHVIVAPARPAGQRCVQCLWLNWIAVQGGTAQLLRAGLLRSAPVDAFSTVAEGVIAVAASVTLHAMQANLARDAYIDLDGGLVHPTVLSQSAWCAHHETLDDAAMIEALPRLKRDENDDRLAPPPRADLASTCTPVGGTAAATAQEMLDGITASVTGSFTASDDHYFTTFAWGGHAATYAKALDIGLVEAHERLATLRRPASRDFITSSLAELGEEGFDPRCLGEYRSEVYQLDPTIEPFDADRSVNWIRGRSLTSGNLIWVPVSAVYFYADDGQTASILASSSGCATGSTAEEATLHALLELIERDAFLSAWYGGRSLPRLSVADLASPEIARLEARMNLGGYGLRILDGTSEFGVPVVVAIAERLINGWGSTTFGAAANLSPARAALTAVKEAAFRIPGFEEASRASRFELEAMLDDYTKVMSLGDHARLYGHPDMKARAGDALGWLAAEEARTEGEASRPRVSRVRPELDISRDLANIVERVACVATDVVAVDVSLDGPGHGLRTVRVLAPGLLPLDFGWERQRALDSPRLARRTTTPDPRSSLVPHPFP